jgi:hypothetical protein
LIIEYLREYEFIFETVIAYESEDLRILFAEKTEGRKSRETVSFKGAFNPLES